MCLCKSLVTHRSHFYILIKPVYKPAAGSDCANLPLWQQESMAEEKCAGFLLHLWENFLIGTLT